MKLKYEMTTMEMDGQIMAVPVNTDDNFNAIIKMNETTSDIMKLLETETTEEKIIDSLLKIYDADRATIAKNVKNVIAALNENGLIE